MCLLAEEYVVFKPKTTVESYFLVLHESNNKKKNEYIAATQYNGNQKNTAVYVSNASKHNRRKQLSQVIKGKWMCGTFLTWSGQGPII